MLSCDGLVLAHVMTDGIERPIAYYSRSLAPAEPNYLQLDKDTLAIICRKCRILTDHKALIGLFGQNKVIPHMTSSRMQRWFLSMSAYDCVLEFRADGLSRLQLGDFPENVSIPEDVVCVLNHMNDTTENVVDIRKLARQGPTLSLFTVC